LELQRRPLVGQVAWVTGSSRGIGRVVATHLASLGCALAVHGTTPHQTRVFDEGDSLENVASAIAYEHEVEVIPVQRDLSDVTAAARAHKEILSRLGKIDILVGCAGGDVGAAGTSGSRGGRPDSKRCYLHLRRRPPRCYRANLMSCIFSCRQVAPAMIARGSGKIVNFGSILALRGTDAGAIYATAKAAVIEYRAAWQRNFGSYNVM